MSESNQPAAGPRGAHWWSRVWWFYVDGFRSMTVGRTLWAIIAIKVVVMFAVLRWIFFPDFLAGKAGDDRGKAAYVRSELVGRRSATPAEQSPHDTPPGDTDDETQTQQKTDNR